MYLLDTNVVSAMRRPERECERLRAWAEGLQANDAYLSAVTVLEIEQGVLARERSDAQQGAILRNWLEDQVLSNYRARILPVDEAVARCCASLHVPNPKCFADSLIAATAICHDMTLVTRNAADFRAISVRLFNPWID